MENTDRNIGESGSVSLEAAIAVPMFFFFMFGIISLLHYSALYFITANAALNASEKLSSDACIFYESGLDNLKDDVRRKAVSLLPTDGASGDIVSYLAGTAFEKLESGAVEAVMFEVFKHELKNELESSGIPIDAEVVMLLGSSFFENGNEFRLCVRTKSNYLIPNIFTGRKGVTVDYIVEGNAWLYGGCPRYKAEDINVWDLEPLERGRVLEEVFGSNLPEMFPVIDIFDRKTGEAAMIVSCDVTAPTYRSFEKVKAVITKAASKLSSFGGGESGGVTVRENEIRSKRLIVIFPDNVADEYIGKVLELNLLCVSEYKINLEVIFYQHSEAYE
ncbi:MAG: pilus assembly protein [Clostridia bacterium]|nr:pilus assembly protein [Clostridia bacterium]